MGQEQSKAEGGAPSTKVPPPDAVSPFPAASDALKFPDFELRYSVPLDTSRPCVPGVWACFHNRVLCLCMITHSSDIAGQKLSELWNKYDATDGDVRQTIRGRLPNDAAAVMHCSFSVTLNDLFDCPLSFFPLFSFDTPQAALPILTQFLRIFMSKYGLAEIMRESATLCAGQSSAGPFIMPPTFVNAVFASQSAHSPLATYSIPASLSLPIPSNGGAAALSGDPAQSLFSPSSLKQMTALLLATAAPSQSASTFLSLPVASAAALRPLWVAMHELCGHPTRIVLGLKREFTSYCIKIDKLLTLCFDQMTDPMTICASQTDAGTVGSDQHGFGAMVVMILLLHVSRFLPNRLLLLGTNFPVFIIKLLKILSSRYESLNVRFAQQSDAFTLSWRDAMQSYIEMWLVACIRLCINLVDPWERWRALPSSQPIDAQVSVAVLSATHIAGSRGSLVFSAPSAASGMASFSRLPPALAESAADISRVLTENGCADVLTGILTNLQSSAVHGFVHSLSFLQRTLLHVTLECAGTLCHHQPIAQQALFRSGGVGIIMNLVGWPTEYSDWSQWFLQEQMSSETQSPSLSFPPVFELQLLSFQVVGEAACGHPESIYFLSRSSGFERCVDLMLWVSIFDDNSHLVLETQQKLLARLSKPRTTSANLQQATFSSFSREVEDSSSTFIYDEFMRDERIFHDLTRNSSRGDEFHLLVPPIPLPSTELHSLSLFQHEFCLPNFMAASAQRQLFDVLYSLCLRSVDFDRNAAAAATRSPTAVAPVSSNAPPLHQYLFHLIFNLFDDNLTVSTHTRLARDYLQASATPFLQHQSIAWWRQILHAFSKSAEEGESRAVQDFLNWLWSHPSIYEYWFSDWFYFMDDVLPVDMPVSHALEPASPAQPVSGESNLGTGPASLQAKINSSLLDFPLLAPSLSLDGQDALPEHASHLPPSALLFNPRDFATPIPLLSLSNASLSNDRNESLDQITQSMLRTGLMIDLRVAVLQLLTTLITIFGNTGMRS
jgi:hypothetical protein